MIYFSVEFICHIYIQYSTSSNLFNYNVYDGRIISEWGTNRSSSPGKELFLQNHNNIN